MIFALVVSLVRATGGWSSADGLEGVASFRVSVVHSTSLGGDASSSTDICGEYGVLTAIEHVSWPTRDSSLVPLVALFRPFHLTYSVINGGSATADGDNDPIATPLAVISPAADQIGTINATRQLPRIVLTEPQNEGPAHEAIAAAISARRAKANTDGRALWGQQGDAASGDECGSVGVSAYMSTVLLAHAIHRAWLGVETMGLTHAHVTPQHVAHEINQHEHIHATHGLMGTLIAREGQENVFAFVHNGAAPKTGSMVSRMLSSEEPLRQLQGTIQGSITTTKSAVGLRPRFIFDASFYWIAFTVTGNRRPINLQRVRLYRKSENPNRWNEGHWVEMERQWLAKEKMTVFLASVSDVNKNKPQLGWRPSFHTEFIGADGAFARGILKSRDDTGTSLVTEIALQEVPNCAEMFTNYFCTGSNAPKDCVKAIDKVDSASDCQAKCQKRHQNFPCKFFKYNFVAKRCTLLKSYTGVGKNIGTNLISGPKYCLHDCYVPTTKFPNGQILGNQHKYTGVFTSASQCQEKCFFTNGCKGFTFWFDRRPKADRLNKAVTKSTTACWLYKTDKGALIIDKSHKEYDQFGMSVSGAATCRDTGCLEWGRKHTLTGKNLRTIKARSLEDCHDNCVREKLCTWFQYDNSVAKGGNNCILKQHRGDKKPTSKNIVFAPAWCTGKNDVARCGQAGKIYTASTKMDIQHIASPMDCARACQDEVDCYFWTWSGQPTKQFPCTLFPRVVTMKNSAHPDKKEISGPKDCAFPAATPENSQKWMCEKQYGGLFSAYTKGPVCCPAKCGEKCNKCGNQEPVECCNWKVFKMQHHGGKRNNVCEQTGQPPCKFEGRQMTYAPWCPDGKCKTVLKRQDVFIPSTVNPAGSLRALAEKRQLKIGTAISYWLRDYSDYLNTIKTHYSVTVAKSECKPGSILQYQWTTCDWIMDFAEQHGMLHRLHAIAWYRDHPGPVRGKPPAEKEAWLMDFTDKYVKRYAGRKGSYHFDIANEALQDGQSSDGTTWIERKGTWMEDIPDWLPKVFRRAKIAADNMGTSINNYYNDFYIISADSGKSGAVYALAKWLMKHPLGSYKGKPVVDGVGFQTHIDVTFELYDGVRQQMRRLGSLGLEVSITEMDVGCGQWVSGQGYVPCGEQWNFEKEYIQGQIYGMLLRMCIEEPNCTAFVIWGTYDPYSWLNTQFQGADHPTPFARGWKKKRAFFEMEKALKA
ncbi:unnamed protein product [Vitrella brassicaformis CCMP3155]|uniref:endo-1,4-beta-xylanase n=2 Tax=Vitrella brassicaformis TaxID=1169539 RepID=A0A0G4G667_VITBC|nr:unnamed protein product [Vitrella brassicaformis CCMP3155]|eukprot:CEM23938.1 unnamed protein product [Vitrella brassicaformis CCMP3155]